MIKPIHQCVAFCWLKASALSCQWCHTVRPSLEEDDNKCLYLMLTIISRWPNSFSLLERYLTKKPSNGVYLKVNLLLSNCMLCIWWAIFNNCRRRIAADWKLLGMCFSSINYPPDLVAFSTNTWGCLFFFCCCCCISFISGEILSLFEQTFVSLPARCLIN